MENITTTDLSDFGLINIKKAQRLLKAWAEQGLPENFVYEEVNIMFNRYSGYVFLTNSMNQSVMLNQGRLDIFYSCPDCCEEGFKEDLEYIGNECCLEYIK